MLKISMIEVQGIVFQTGALLIMGKWWVYTYTWGMRTDCIMCGVLYKYITILSVLYDEYLASDLQCLLISSQLLNPTISPSCCCWWSSPTLPNSSNPFLVLLLHLLLVLPPLLSHALLYFSPLSIVKCVISHPPLSLTCVFSGGLRLEKLANWGQPEHLVLTRKMNFLSVIC